MESLGLSRRQLGRTGEESSARWRACARSQARASSSGSLRRRRPWHSARSRRCPAQRRGDEVLFLAKDVCRTHLGVYFFWGTNVLPWFLGATLLTRSSSSLRLEEGVLTLFLFFGSLFLAGEPSPKKLEKGIPGTPKVALGFNLAQPQFGLIDVAYHFDWGSYPFSVVNHFFAEKNRFCTCPHSKNDRRAHNLDQTSWVNEKLRVLLHPGTQGKLAETGTGEGETGQRVPAVTEGETKHLG